ncbi:alpha/beta hydrolase [Chitinimonas sp.]|uniref:alpha/beta hydrolase n=1 Tax=Chitinimonas sp. TaxID=1934313 RepID=UPI0035B284DC
MNRYLAPLFLAGSLLALVAPPCAAADKVRELPAAATPMPGCGETAGKAGRPLREQGYWSVGGIEQWLTIESANCNNPVLLFVHGGPGNPVSPFSHAMYGAWAKDFTLVQWDQRGAGKTFARNPHTADASLSLEQMSADGIEVAQLLQRHLGQRKIILTGSSWGSVLGIMMAKQRPDLFHAYIGVSQMVSASANESAAYTLTLAAATKAGDAKTVAALQEIGPPPRSSPRAFGILRRAIRAYERKVTIAAPAKWWNKEAQYATPAALAADEQGEEYSFMQFVGLKGDGMLSRIDLPALGTRFEIPIYLLQGQEDLLTPAVVTQPYFDSLEAPAKAMVMVPKAGHDPNPALLDAQWKVLKERVLPGLRGNQ